MAVSICLKASHLRLVTYVINNGADAALIRDDLLGSKWILCIHKRVFLTSTALIISGLKNWNDLASPENQRSTDESRI